MAHPKLGSVAQRSLLAATSAALMAGPLAVPGAAQTLDTVTDSTTQVVDLTCKEAKQTEDKALIEEFCDSESETAERVEQTARNSGDNVTATVQSVTKKAPTGGGDGDSDGSPTPDAPVSESDQREQQPAGGGANYTAVSEASDGSGSRPRSRSRIARQRATAGPRFNAHGPILPGMRSNSLLTLQPFAAPLVSVPPIYELPQIAQQMFGSTAATGPEEPLAAGAEATQASPYTAAGHTATPADPAGWLAATATGLIMLVGAGHALNGGRMPRRQHS
ncbi:MAG: hypothetical protein GEU74_14940 [Nitriliruptorales bacterium]|nr:hypothetical protein [Nitriliruptorales bacterium]